MNLSVETNRLLLEAVTVAHAPEFVELFSDTRLHEFVPFEPLNLEEQTKRCERWAKSQSPDGEETWLNWAAREKTTQKVVGHFQGSVKRDGVAIVGYVLARSAQGKGLAFEAMQTIFELLSDRYDVREIKAWTDTRNLPSHRLAKRLGMTLVQTIKDADFFKGHTSDEYVFSLVLKP